ncbi:hypothetical protein M3Y94_00030000 [Aphelenchoides besseyi]|nr:hypothetical protein M3Y94_00030000 [Aphelenchoides besseyi]KAI6218571.1 hypothetical protein M3Y95_01157000 [Aphelenchoides besseyi]
MQFSTLALCASTLLAMSLMVDAQRLRCYTCDSSGQTRGFSTDCVYPGTSMLCDDYASCVRIVTSNRVTVEGCLADQYGHQWHSDTKCWYDAIQNYVCACNSFECNAAPY